MVALADLVEQPPGSDGNLSDGQVRCVTSPPGHAITRDRAAFAQNLRASAAAVARQLPGDAAKVSGPYAYRGGRLRHPGHLALLLRHATADQRVFAICRTVTAMTPSPVVAGPIVAWP